MSETMIKELHVDKVIDVSNVKVYGLKDSIMASGYPMVTDISKSLLDRQAFRRARSLGSSDPGSGHDCFLKGITVQFDLTVPEYIWRQLDRYHFIDYVSSQSKMHRITKIDLDATCNKYVMEDTIKTVKELIDLYNNFDDPLILDRNKVEYRYIILRNGDHIPYTKVELWNMIVSNIPSGLRLTARMTTNYLQLKQIVNQRHNHKMQEWRYFTDWCINELPEFNYLTSTSFSPDDR